MTKCAEISSVDIAVIIHVHIFGFSTVMCLNLSFEREKNEWKIERKHFISLTVIIMIFMNLICLTNAMLLLTYQHACFGKYIYDSLFPIK